MTKQEAEAQIREILGCFEVSILYQPDTKFYEIWATFGDNTDSDGYKIASFKLGKLYNCSGIGVVYAIRTAIPFRNLGIGEILHQYRLFLAKESGFTILLCTVDRSNKVQNHSLLKQGWTMIHEFTNNLTTHLVGIWVLPLGALNG